MRPFKNRSFILKIIYCTLVFSSILISCGRPLPTLDGIDLQSWKADKNGCSGKRAAMQESLIEQHEKLLTLKEIQIVELLGKPDQNELYTRNQKFFYYYLQPSKECNASDSYASDKTILIVES